MTFVLALAATLAFAPAPNSDCARISVHDGDTIRCDGERIRLLDIDAPEMEGSPRCRHPRPRDWCDYQRAVESRDRLARFLRSGTVRILRDGKDRYRRTLAHVTVDGRDAGEWLLSIGLAKPYR